MKKIIILTLLASTFTGYVAIAAAPRAQAAPMQFDAEDLRGQTAPEDNLTKQGLKGSLFLFKRASDKAGFPEGALPPEVVIGQLIKALIVLMGVIFGVLVVYAGFLWMTARGIEEQVKKSKNILENAAIGIIIVVAAYAITTFVVDKVISSSFQVPTPAAETSPSP